MGVLRDTARRSLGGTVHCRGGTIVFGADMDTQIARSAANTLSVGANDTLKVGAGGSLSVNVGGTIQWGSEVSLYRGAATELKTDTNFFAVGILKSGVASGTFNVTTGGTVQWGSEVSLYRGDANTVYSSGKLYGVSDVQSATNIITRDCGGTEPLGVLATDGGLQVGVLGGTARVYAQIGGTMYCFSGLAA